MDKQNKVYEILAKHDPGLANNDSPSITDHLDNLPSCGCAKCGKGRFGWNGRVWRCTTCAGITDAQLNREERETLNLNPNHQY